MTHNESTANEIEIVLLNDPFAANPREKSSAVLRHWLGIYTAPNDIKAKKRLDIQGLRAIAILGVLLFHLWPNIFTTGYLGVDVFFVLSGYLIAQMLDGRPVNLASVLRFYRRRLQRIVPMYLLVTYCTLAAGSYLLTIDDFESLRNNAVPALLFATNLHNVYARDDYFVQIKSSYRFFLHTWSLGVEMQFYLIAPLLILPLRGPRARPHALKILAVLGLSSVGLQLVSSDAVAFGLMPCRLWQFCAGLIVYFASSTINCDKRLDSMKSYMELRDNRDEGKKLPKGREKADFASCSDEDAHPTLRDWHMAFYSTVIDTALKSLICIILFFPGALNFANATAKTVEQVAVIVATGFLLYSGGSGPRRNGCTRWLLLENSIMVAVGDASYICYLIHWPLIQFVLYIGSEIGASLDLLIALLLLLVSIIAAWVLNEFADSRLRRIKNTWALSLSIGSLYGACLMFTLPAEVQKQLWRIIDGRTIPVNNTDTTGIMEMLLPVHANRNATNL